MGAAFSGLAHLHGEGAGGVAHREQPDFFIREARGAHLGEKIGEKKFKGSEIAPAVQIAIVRKEHLPQPAGMFERPEQAEDMAGVFGGQVVQRNPGSLFGGFQQGFS